MVVEPTHLRYMCQNEFIFSSSPIFAGKKIGKDLEVSPPRPEKLRCLQSPTVSSSPTVFFNDKKKKHQKATPPDPGASPWCYPCEDTIICMEFFTQPWELKCPSFFRGYNCCNPYIGGFKTFIFPWVVGVRGKHICRHRIISSTVIVLHTFHPPFGCQISAQKGLFLVGFLGLKFHTQTEDSGVSTILELGWFVWFTGLVSHYCRVVPSNT